jgi:APA family basic amino acid/polyamine antiporter
MMLSQPRVWLAMARDGMVPPSFFGAVHHKYRTPHRATILTGILVAIGAAFLPLRILADLTNIGTLFAFVVVSIGVVVLRRTRPDLPRAFRTPFVPVLPILAVLACLWLMLNLPVDTWIRFGVWMAVGFVVYFGYGMRAAAKRRSTEAVAATPVSPMHESRDDVSPDS